MAHKRIRCKNLETGKIAYHGENFLKMQPKPVLADSGNFYENGLWVLDTGKPLSQQAREIIDNSRKK